MFHKCLKKHPKMGFIILRPSHVSTGTVLCPSGNRLPSVIREAEIPLHNLAIPQRIDDRLHQFWAPHFFSPSPDLPKRFGGLNNSKHFSADSPTSAIVDSCRLMSRWRGNTTYMVVSSQGRVHSTLRAATCAGSSWRTVRLQRAQQRW